jgi:hypothetical protein
MGAALVGGISTVADNAAISIHRHSGTSDSREHIHAAPLAAAAREKNRSRLESL